MRGTSVDESAEKEIVLIESSVQHEAMDLIKVKRGAAVAKKGSECKRGCENGGLDEGRRRLAEEGERPTHFKASIGE